MDSNLRRVGIAVAKAKTYYERWMEKEGVPIVEGLACLTLDGFRYDRGAGSVVMGLIFSSEVWRESPEFTSAE